MGEYFDVLLAEAVQTQLAADALWRVVESMTDRWRPLEHDAIQAWRDACDVSGMDPLAFGETFLAAKEQARAEAEVNDGG